MSSVQPTDIQTGGPVPPSDEYKIMVLLVDDQAMVGEAIRRALLNPADHRPWLDVARAREGQGALVGAQEALSRATILDGGAAVSARAARERVRLQLN